MSMLKPSSECLKAIISLGMASCINQIAMAIVQIVLNNILRYYGGLSVYGSDIPIACVGVISKVNQVFMAICIGISQGCQPIWGFNYGAKKLRQGKTCISLFHDCMYRDCNCIFPLFSVISPPDCKYFRNRK